jgi:putative DNA primase/helicase
MTGRDDDGYWDDVERMVKEAAADLAELEDEPPKEDTADSEAGDAEEPEPEARDHRPVIQVEAGHIARTIDEAEAALVAANRPIFERAKRLVIPITSTLPAADDLKTDVITFKEMQTANMVYALNKYAATFRKWDGRSKQLEVINPPTNVALGLLVKGEWSFPVVTGVITTPTMRPDGILIDVPGYDEKTQLWYQPDRQLMITPIKADPTRQDAEVALTILLELLVEFPFVNELDCSVAVAGLMTPVLRGAFDVGPLTFVRAHAAGSGKTFLVNLISRLLTARPCPVIEEAPNNEELGKKLDAAIFQGWQIICIDNCLFDIGGAKLCQVAEQQIVGIRILGKTEVIPCEWRGTSFATGNNVGVTADMTRRTLYCNLDPKVDRPENREFKGNPVDLVLADRWKYLSAVLTIARAWRVAGSPIPDGVPPIGSYGQWAKAVRYPLIWLGMEDPVKSMEEAREEDPERNAARILLSSIRALFKEPPKHDGSPSPNSAVFDAGELVKALSTNEYGLADDEKFETERLRGVLRERCEGDITSIKVGMWLKAIKGQVHDGHRLELMKETGMRAARYRVQKCS